MGLRETKRQSTRDDLARAAGQLASERGASATTIEDIARAANVAPRTLFNHFVSKEAAILGIDRDRASEVARRLIERPTDESPLEALMQSTFGLSSGSGPHTWRRREALVQSDPMLNAAYVGTFAALDDAVTIAMAARLGLDPAEDVFPRLVVTLGFSAMRVTSQHLVTKWPWPADAAEEDIRAEVQDEVRRTLAGLEAGLVVLAPHR